MWVPPVAATDAAWMQGHSQLTTSDCLLSAYPPVAATGHTTGSLRLAPVGPPCSRSPTSPFPPPHRATTAGVRSSPIRLPIDSSCPPSLTIGHTYVLGLMGKGPPLGGIASGCELVVNLSSAGAVSALRPVYAFPRKPCNAIINGDCTGVAFGRTTRKP